VGDGVLVADVETAGAEFFHSHKDNRWESRGSRCAFSMIKDKYKGKAK
jgi:hypothetical protein